MKSRIEAHGNLRLSLSMIVRNEQQFLEGCLLSVEGVADEIVIVDTGSTDETIAIARRHGARIFEQPWNGDFSQARNESLRHCRGEWVLYLDADERLLPAQGDAILSLLRDASVSAYNVIVRNTITLPTGTSVQRMPYPRLFRKSPGVCFEGRVHEQLAGSIEARGGMIRPCGIVIEHLGYNQGFDLLKKKADRNLQLLLESNRGDGYASYQVGNTCLMFQQFTEAKEHFARALSSASLSHGLRAHVYNLMAEAELRTGLPARAAECCRESLRLAPHQVTARWYLVGASIRQQDYAGAEAIIKEMLARSLRESANGMIDVALDIQVEEATAMHVMGQCQMQQGDSCAAAKTFSRALELTPVSAEIRASFLEAQAACADRIRANAEQLMEQGDYRGAGRLIDAAEAGGTRSFALERLGIDVALRERDLQKAKHHLERMAGYIPEDNPTAKQQLLALAAKLMGEGGAP